MSEDENSDNKIKIKQNKDSQLNILQLESKEN